MAAFCVLEVMIELKVEKLLSSNMVIDGILKAHMCFFFKKKIGTLFVECLLVLFYVFFIGKNIKLQG